MATLSAFVVTVRNQGIDARRYMVVPRTLVFIRHSNDVLLLRRSHDRNIWPGRLNGVGGHVEAGESLAESALREVVEETGLSVRVLELAGLLHVTEPTTLLGVLVAVFTATSDSREVVASPEGRLRWMAIDEVLGGVVDDDLVPDLLSIFPRLWNGEAGPPFLANITEAGDIVFSN